MISKEVYKEIQHFKEEGLGINQTAHRVDKTYPTVKAYWDMSEDEYDQKYQRVHRGTKKSQIGTYGPFILELLKEEPNLFTSQIYKKLKERYGDKINFSDRTARNYVKKIREENDIYRTLKYKKD